MVPAFSPIAVATVDKPTGPPLNFSTIAFKIRISISSKPLASTFNAFKATSVIFSSMTPLPLI